MMYYFVCSMGTVGHDRMTEEQIVDNILAAASIIKERVPGGPDNIRSILIKCTDSLSIPLHTNIGKYLQPHTRVVNLGTTTKLC